MKKFETMLVVIILLLSISAIGIMKFWGTDNQNNTIAIKVDNEVVQQISLGANPNKSEIYDFQFNNNIGYVEIDSGRVRMLEMSRELCPKAICSDTGWISKPYQSIVCLPNKIIVAIEGSHDYDIDDAVY